MSELKFSHSQMWQWDACQVRWYFSYVAGYSLIRSAEPLILGSKAHKMMAHYYQGVIENEPNPRERLKNFVQNMTSEPGAVQDISLISRAYKAVDNYIEYYAPIADTEFRPVEVEKHYEIEVTTPAGNEIIFQMYLDLIMEHVPTGKYWLVDHKTHNARKPSKTAVLMMPQLPTYAKVLRDRGVDVFGTMYNFLNTYDYKKPQPPEKFFHREKMYRSPYEVEAIFQEQLKGIDQIIANYENPKRSMGPDCDRCPFQDPCMMLLKGHTEKEAFDPAIFKKGEVNEFYQDESV